MARKQFLSFIFSDNKRPLYIDDNGFLKEGNENFLKLNGETAHLTYTPVAWQDYLVKYARNIKYWALNRTLTVPLNFVGDGYRILKNRMWTLGPEAVLYFGMLKLDKETLPYIYKPWYFSELNLMTIKQNKTTFTVEALEGGMSKILKAFETTDYTIDIESDPERVQVLLDGLSLIGSYTWFLGSQQLQVVVFGGASFSPTMPELAREGQSTGITFQSVSYMRMNISDISENGPSSGNWFLRADENITFNLVGSFNVKLSVLRDQKFFAARILKHKIGDPLFSINPSNIITLFDADSPNQFENQGDIREIQVNLNITLDAGYGLYWIWDDSAGTGFGDASDFEVVEDNELKVTYTNKFKSTYCWGLPVYTLFKRIVEQMVKDQVLLPTDTGVFHKSDWLANKKDLVITSGAAIRGLAEPKIVTSISDFFQSMTHYSVCLGVENGKLFIEPYNYAFSDQIIADLGEVADVEVRMAEDLMFNTIKTGGPEIDYDDLNGLYEMNQSQNWRTPLSKFATELDLTTPYRRDPIGSELLRIKYQNKDTTDGEGDKDTFMFSVNEQPETVGGVTFRRLKRPAYSSITGVPFPAEIFNTDLTPKWTLINNGVRIHSALDYQEANSITQTKADKNKDFETILDGFVMNEGTPIPIASLAARKWKPYYFKFKTKVPLNFMDIMNTNPYGKVRFTVLGEPFYAYMFDGGIKAAMRDSQEWNVLSSHENDLTKFYGKLY